MLRGVGVGVWLYVAVHKVVSVPAPGKVFRPDYCRGGAGVESPTGLATLARSASVCFRARVSPRERRA